MKSREIDLHAGYYEEMWNDFETNPFLNYAGSWYGQLPPYQAALASMVNVAFNHERAPFNETLLREAMAWMIDYDPIPAAAASGYTRRAEPTFLDNFSTVQNPYFNKTLADQYRRSYNTTKAAQILEDHGCEKQPDGSWVSDKYGALGYEDGNPSGAVWTMICPQTWLDVRTFTELVCESFTDFGIPVNSEIIDIDYVGWNTWSHLWTDRNYDLGASCGEPKVIETPEVFFNGWREFKDWNINITGWHDDLSKEFNSLYLTLENQSDPVIYNQTLSRIQEIFCMDIPEIPCFVNGYWYTTSSYYWSGWCNANNEYQQLVTESTNDAIPMKTRMILNLVSTGREYDRNPPTWTEVPIDQNITYGKPFYYDVNATDDSGYIVYFINDTVNFMIDSLTGLITNKINLNVGTYNLTIFASDWIGNSINETICIQVIKDDTVPGYDLMLVIFGIFTTIIPLSLYKWKKISKK
ncbi:MAG: hypothetical protein JXA99_06030 [Candidatus Lokiarchaeota archaeon]|nr:hypothetical protein [Candidatus Lokiarchaeota archaeon]